MLGSAAPPSCDAPINSEAAQNQRKRAGSESFLQEIASGHMSDESLIWCPVGATQKRARPAQRRTIDAALLDNARRTHHEIRQHGEDRSGFAMILHRNVDDMWTFFYPRRILDKNIKS